MRARTATGYTPCGASQTVIDPDGVTSTYSYETGGTLHKQPTRTSNMLGKPTTVVDGLDTTVFNANASTSYDANGNLIQSSDGLGIQCQLGYDALNRLVQTIDNYNGTN
ncbi:RHS repeat domain-containing protein [Dyella monticola]|uniref:RHS repeat domain-containing protein n=1 Tax=Dyella monticola TaxID=1927958 RepID=UPI0013149EB5|nr:RHS repeat domain-containing protein [Dyella monticola]